MRRGLLSRMHGLAIHAGRQSRDGRKGLRRGDLGVLGALPGTMRDGGLHWEVVVVVLVVVVVVVVVVVKTISSPGTMFEKRRK